MDHRLIEWDATKKKKNENSTANGNDKLKKKLWKESSKMDANKDPRIKIWKERNQKVNT